MIEKMRLYYIAYRYSDGQIEMLDGPYGTASEASTERNNMCGDTDDPRLVVVWSIVEVKVLE